MTSTATDTDLGFGVGIALSIVTLIGALATVYFGYAAAMAHDSGGAAQLNSGIAFGVAMLTGVVAIAAFHAYEA